MGAKLTPVSSEEASIHVVSWLDTKTSALVRAITATVAQRHPDLLAVILYGSVARHDERSLDDPRPSDVDLLLIFDTDEKPAVTEGDAIFHSIGLGRDRYFNTPREVHIMLASREMKEWDPSFVAHVVRDGQALFARGPLPAALAPLTDQRTSDPRRHQSADQDEVARA